MRWAAYLKQKSDVPGAIRNFMQFVETQTGLKVKRWHSDNGGEFMLKVMDGIAKAHGIEHEPTAPYNPEQMGPPNVPCSPLGTVLEHSSRLLT